MRPLLRAGRSLRDGLDRAAGRRSDGVELGVPEAVLYRELEVLAHVLVVGRVLDRRPDRTLDYHRVVERRRPHPAFDGVLQERRIVRVAHVSDRVELLDLRHSLQRGGAGRTLEVHRLATARRVGVLRVGRSAELAFLLLGVADAVVVGVEALVLLERADPVRRLGVEQAPVVRREGRVVRRRKARGRHPAVEVAELVRLVPVGERVAGREGVAEAGRHAEEPVDERAGEARVCHPERRRVGVERVGVELRHHGLGLVRHHVAVRVGVHHAVQPGEDLEVVSVASRRLPRALLPEVGRGAGSPRLERPGVGRPGVVDEVAGGLGGELHAALAEKRVHAVEELVVVVHAVAVGVGLDRRAAGVLLRRHAHAGRQGQDLSPDVLDHGVADAVVEPVVGAAGLAEPGVEVCGIPHVREAREVLRAGRHVGYEERVVVRARLVNERVVPELVAGHPHVLVLRIPHPAERGERPVELGRERLPRRERVVVAPAAHHARHVLLPVL